MTEATPIKSSITTTRRSFLQTYGLGAGLAADCRCHKACPALHEMVKDDSTGVVTRTGAGIDLSDGAMVVHARHQRDPQHRNH
ncbi:MAG: hypothetical protein IT577_18065 [Verrucomicrobiae bacterium]|nr:hypothetical protein [Verrucomicrobiae bacterium]